MTPSLYPAIISTPRFTLLFGRLPKSLVLHSGHSGLTRRFMLSWVLWVVLPPGAARGLHTAVIGVPAVVADQLSGFDCPVPQIRERYVQKTMLPYSLI